MVTLDALSAYWIASHTAEERVLNVTLSSLGRNGFKSHALQLNNHQDKGLEEELKVTHTFPDGVPWGFGPGQKHGPPPCVVMRVQLSPEGVVGRLTFLLAA